ncbi:MAG: M20/M25/M40 family metallo-hydrolase [Candidatus Brocadiia bacterium]
MGKISGEIAEQLQTVLEQADIRQWVVQMVEEMVNIDTIPSEDLKTAAEQESHVFDLIEEHVRDIYGTECEVERAPIDPRIQEEPAYTQPFYAGGADGEVPSADMVYENRCNLVVRIPGQEKGIIAINAHVDTVGPFFPFEKKANRLVGRGAVDDKGQIAMILAAARILKQVGEASEEATHPDLCLQFVIDEEMGGNGSLSLAADRQRRWDCVVVCEATEQKAHPANRGATWYRIELSTNSRINAGLVGAEILLALRKEGETIRSESDHPLFPDRPVQTCNGEFGSWGMHPSRVCPMMGLSVVSRGNGSDDLRDRVDSCCQKGCDAYCQKYGDATEKPDIDAPGQPMVIRHYDIVDGNSDVFVAVYGRSGHMGKIRELDCAATKAAYIFRELADEFEDDEVELVLADAPPAEQQRPPQSRDDETLYFEPNPDSQGGLVLEGGQGFVPTHSIEDVQARVENAAREAMKKYLEEKGESQDAASLRVSFERLHNNAFERPVECPCMRAMVAAREAAGCKAQKPIRGWEVSCDARLFADLRPGSDIVTFGAGELRYAHSEEESVRTDEIMTGAKVLAYFALLYGI